MGSFHRDFPELCGTDRDPWMSNPGHRRAAQDVTLLQGCVLTRGEVEDQGLDWCECGKPAASHRDA